MLASKYRGAGRQQQQRKPCSWKAFTLRQPRASPVNHDCKVNVADPRVVCFDLDTAICDCSPVVLSCAYDAAKKLWPERVVGHKSLFVRAAREVLPMIGEYHETVVLIRLLCDEGVIGARSTAGRQGPVVGRSLRASGTRPLLTAEITEHWRNIWESCLLRWSLDDGKSQDVLVASIHTAFLEAQDNFVATNRSFIPDSLKPYPTIVEAVKGCQSADILLSSSLPSPLAELLVRCADLPLDGSIEIVTEAKLPALLPNLQYRGVGHATFVSGRLSWIKQVSCLAALGGSIPDEIDLRLATWCGASPSMRAKCLTLPRAQLLEEHELAELLQVTHLKTVMDGISWC